MSGGAGQLYFSILTYSRRRFSSCLAFLQTAVTETRPREWKERSEAQGSCFPPFLMALLQGKSLGLSHESPVERIRKKTVPVTPPLPSMPSSHTIEKIRIDLEGQALHPAFSLQSQHTDLKAFFFFFELRLSECDSIETVKA